MIEAVNFIDQLVNIYFNEEWWDSPKMSKVEIRQYYETAIRKGRILFYEEFGKILGYLESWRLDYEQWGRIICQEKFNIAQEDINTGQLCYLNSIWIDKSRRFTNIFKLLKLDFFRQNYRCDYFVGRPARIAAKRKRKHRIIMDIVKRPEFIEKYLKGVKNGK